MALRPSKLALAQADALGLDIAPLLASCEQLLAASSVPESLHYLLRKSERDGFHVLAAIEAESQPLPNLRYVTDVVDPKTIIVNEAENDGQRYLAWFFLVPSRYSEALKHEPVLVLQEFAQHVGEILEVGQQRNRFVYHEEIPLPSAKHMFGLLLPAKSTTWLIWDERETPGTKHIDLAFAINEAKYLEWLTRIDDQTRPSYRSVFISYGEADRDFATELRNELTRYGVDCWLYSLDSTYGRRTWEEIDEQITKRDRFLVVCSIAALIRDPVLKEIETVIDRSPEKLVCVSKDLLWQEAGFVVRRGSSDLKPFLLERNFADFTHRRHFGERTRRLLKALEKPTA